MATTSETKLIEAYIGLLGRAPDPDGLEYWADALDAAGGGDVALKKLVKDITLSAEWASGLGANDSSTRAGADAVLLGMFNNLFGYSPSQADYDYYSPKLMAGEFTSASLVVVLIQGADATDAATLGLKTEAATYYVETIDQADFTVANAGSAVSSVDSPLTLAASKEATDAIATGVGSTFALTTANDAPAMTGGTDTVTGTVGDGATFADNSAGADTHVDVIADTSALDNDTLTLTGDDGFTFGAVTNVENINVSLAKALGSTFTIDADKLAGGNFNLTTASTLEVAGVDVSGATTAVVNNYRGDLSTTGVTNLTVDANESGGAITIAGDAALTTLTVTDANDAGVAITMANDTAVTVNLGGESDASGNDAVTLLANNTVALKTDQGGDAIEFLTLGGNTNEVTFDLQNAVDPSSKYTLTGEYDVTVQGDADMFDGATVVDSSSGASEIVLDVAKGGALDLTAVSVDSVKVGYASASDNISFNDSVSVEIAADVATSLTITQGNGNDATLSISLDGGTDGTIDLGALDVEQFAKATIAAGDETINGLALSGDAGAGSNDTEVVIVGTNDITGTTVDTDTADFTVSGKAVEFTTINANDIELTATDSVTATNVTAEVNGSLTVTATNEVSLGNIDLAQGGAGVAGEDLVVSGNEVSIGTIDADDVTLTATNDARSSSTGAITATNDVTVNDGKFTLASVDAGGTTSVTGDARVTVTGTLASDEGVIVTSTMPVDLGTVNAPAVNAGSATNDITATLTNTVSTPLVASTGSGNDAITLTDTDAVYQLQTGAGLDVITVTGVGASSVINTGAGNDTITSTEGDVSYTVSAGAGADTITVSATDDMILDGGDDTDTLKLAADTDHSGTSLSFTNIEVIDITAGDATISAAAFANDSSFLLIDGDDGGDEKLEILDTLNLGATIDASAVVHDADRLAILDITGGTGNDTITGSAGDNTIVTGNGVNLVNGGAGSDTITGGTGNDTLNGNDGGDNITAGGGVDIVNGGGGDDTIDVTGTANNQNDVINGGAGTDTINVEADTVFDDVNANITNIENVTLQAGFDVTLTGQTEAFTITGSTGAEVIVSGSGADTIEGGAGADTITGAGGNDTIGLGDGDTAADTVVFSAAASNGVDTIDDFETGTDTLDVSGAGDLEGTISMDTAADGAAIALSAAKGLIVSDATAADWSDVLTIMNAAIDTTGDVTGDTIIIVDNGTDSRIYLYQDDQNAAAIEAGELTLIGVIDGEDTLAEGDIDPVG